PPDPDGDVSRTQYMQTTNNVLGVWDKTGTLLHTSLISTLWRGFGAPCEGATGEDPTVVYDRPADRWLLAFSGGYDTGPYYLGLAHEHPLHAGRATAKCPLHRTLPL